MTCHFQNFQLHLLWLFFVHILYEAFRLLIKVKLDYINWAYVATVLLVSEKWNTSLQRHAKQNHSETLLYIH